MLLLEMVLCDRIIVIMGNFLPSDCPTVTSSLQLPLPPAPLSTNPRPRQRPPSHSTRVHHSSYVPPLTHLPPPPNLLSFKFPSAPHFLRTTPPMAVTEDKTTPFPLPPAPAPAPAVKLLENEALKLRSDFLRLLLSTRTAQVPLSVEKAKPVTHPLFQDANPPAFSEVMESCPKADNPNLKDLLKEENLYVITEGGEQGRMPVLILSLKRGDEEEERKPAVVFLHSTHKNKEWLRPLLEAYASRGYVSIAIDSRYHGERARSKTTYRDAWDLIKLADYLTQREDIDSTRIGITGESLGGMHAWFGAFADKRYSVVAPIIGVQGFRWAIDNDKWEPRVDSIRAVFEEARIDLGKRAIDKEVVEKVWNRIAPGLASNFDAPYTVPAISPRPLLILNGAEDPRCPCGGLEILSSRAYKAYDEANVPDKFKVITETGIGHQMTKSMVKAASDWFDKYLKQ
ncbi:hypothetical protein LINPERPRIM_LOCUS1425 [Linum perenne]